MIIGDYAIQCIYIYRKKWCSSQSNMEHPDRCVEGLLAFEHRSSGHRPRGTQQHPKGVRKSHRGTPKSSILSWEFP